MQVNVYQNDLAIHTAEAISKCLRNAHEKQVLFFVSGGSALKVLDYLDPSIFGKNITVSFIDERYSIDPEVSNFLALTRTSFYEKAQAHGVHFISSLPLPRESMEQTTQRWEKELRIWKSECTENSMIVALLGIGDDGHTAGIMPFPEDPEKFQKLFVDTNKWIVGYNAGSKNKYPLRMTVSLDFLSKAPDELFVYVEGEKKRNILKKVLATENMTHFPAAIINTKKNTKLYTDILM